MTRREQFRAFMASVAPAADPMAAIANQFYVDPPDAVSSKIKARLELEPDARLLVVGTIGAGKTTELLIAQRALAALPDVEPSYIDVGRIQDLGKMSPGCLVAIASTSLLAGATGVDADMRTRIKDFAQGWFDDEYGEFTGDYERGLHRPGALKPPAKDWPNIWDWAVDDLRSLAEARRREGRYPVLILDSLDRVTDISAFEAVVREDMAAIKSCGIGIVLVGPVRALDGFGRLLVDRFDDTHVQGPVDVRADGPGRRFLAEVLSRRVSAQRELLSDEAISALVGWSGGVLRDLIALAKLAAEEAYVRGHDSILPEDAMRAAARFGRAMLLGLEADQLETLKNVRTSGRFVPIGPTDFALLAGRQILEYRIPALTHVVHPSIAGLLDDVGGAR